MGSQGEEPTSRVEQPSRAISLNNSALMRLCEMARDLLCICGFDGTFRVLNPAWEDTLGWSIHDLTTRPFLEFVHPRDYTHTEAAFRRLLSGADVTPAENFVNRYRHMGGRYVWLQWTATSDPRNGLVFATAQDVSRMRELAEENAELRRQLRALTGPIAWHEEDVPRPTSRPPVQRPASIGQSADGDPAPDDPKEEARDGRASRPDPDPDEE